MAIDKRKALQPVLDSIEKGWQITKPSPRNPNDLETECIFQHTVKGHKQVRIVIDNGLIDSAIYRSFKTLFDPLSNRALRFIGLRFTVQAELKFYR
jgi:hypothetical protein